MFPWVVVPGMLLGVPSSLVAATRALPGVVPACCVYLVRCCGVPGFVVRAGALGVGCAGGCWRGFTCCRVPVWLLCAAADCAPCLQSLLFAAGSLRLLLCPDASSALCPVLHATSHLDVSNTHTWSGKTLQPRNHNILKSKTLKAQIQALQIPSCYSAKLQHSSRMPYRRPPGGRHNATGTPQPGAAGE